MAKRPKTVKVDPYRAYVRRGPRDDGRWYWQVGHYRSRKLVQAFCGWFTPGEVGEAMRKLPAEPGSTPQPHAGVTTVEHLLATWYAEQKRRVSRGSIKPATLHTYRHMCLKMLPLIGDVRVDAVTHDTLKTTKEELESYLGIRTVHTAFSIFRSAWKWAFLRGLVERPLPAFRVAKPKGKLVYTLRTPSVEEAEAVIAWLWANSPGWPAMHCEIMLSTGARPRAVGQLKWGDVDLSQGVLTMGVKTGIRDVVIPDRLIGLLKQWKTRPGSGEWLLGVLPGTVTTSGQTFVRRACDALGIPRFTPKGFRRLVATQLIGSMHQTDPVDGSPLGMGPKEYEAHMGHSLEMGMRIYAESSTDRKRRAVNRLGGSGARVIPFPTLNKAGTK